MRAEFERNAAGDAALPPAPDALRPETGIGHGTPDWGLEQDAVRPGCHSWGTLRGGIGEGNGMQRSPANGYVVRRRTGGNCAATVSVRPADSVRPEQEEAAVPLSVSSSYAAVVGKQPELVVRSNRRL